MGCRNCRTPHAFKQKLGRCRRCMAQLTVLSILSWVTWFYFYLPTPKVVRSITLIFAAAAFSLLLLAHWVVALMLWVKGKGNNPRQQPSP